MEETWVFYYVQPILVNRANYFMEDIGTIDYVVW